MDLDGIVPMQSGPITTKVCEFISCPWHIVLISAVRWFSVGFPFSSTNRTDHYYITVIILKAPIITSSPLDHDILDHFFTISVLLFNIMLRVYSRNADFMQIDFTEKTKGR